APPPPSIPPLSLHDALPIYTHPGLLEHVAKMAIHDGMGGEIVDATEAHVFHLQQPMPHPAARIGRMHATNHWRLLDDRQDLVLRSEEHTSELQSRRDLVCRL